MPVEVRTTPGARDANSNASVADFRRYVAERIGTALAATSADDDLVGQALITMTRVIEDRFDWPGSTRTYRNGRLSFPRTGFVHYDTGDVVDPETTPEFLVDATCEGAVHLITGDRLLPDAPGLGVSSVSIPGAVSVSFDKGVRPVVVPSLVVEMLERWGARQISDFGAGGIRTPDLLRV